MPHRTGSDALLRRGLKLSHLRLMAALADAGQIGLAAERLGMAQPAASRLLAEVERIVGQPVHERTGRGVALTAAGAALARRAARVLMELSDTGREIAEIGAGQTGHVRIGAVTGPALDRVLPALRTARLALPGVTSEVIVQPSDVLNQQLLTGRVDFAIARLPEGPDAALLDCRTIAGEPVTLMARRGHPLDRAAPVTPDDLMAHDWVMPGPEAILTRTVLARLRALGLPRPPQRVATASFLLTLALLQQSNAIAPIARAVGDAFAGAPEAPFVQLKVDLGIEVEPFGLITRTRMELPPVARRLADLILAQPSSIRSALAANSDRA